MTDSFLENAGGWTPVPDVLFRKYGYESAYLWGRIRRLCQLGGGSYTISHEALGDRIGMSRRTVFDRLKELIRDGYVEDLTPGVRNKPHTYSVQKGEEKIVSLGVQISHTDIDMPAEAGEDLGEDIDVGMRNLHSESAKNAQSDNPTMQNLHTDYAEIAQPAMQNLHLNRESLDTDSRDKEQLAATAAPPLAKSKNPKEGARASPEQQQLFLVLAGLCRISLKVATDKQIGQLDQATKALLKTPIDPDQFNAKFSDYWESVDWRGKQGQPPTPPQIREVYGDYCHWLENGCQKASRNGHKPTGILRQTGEYLDDQPTFDPYTGKEIPARGAT